MGSEPDSLQRAVRTLAHAARGLERAAAPLTLSQYRVLALTVTAPERASRLAAQVDVTRASLTGVLDALEHHGWIVREVVEGDRRGVSLAVTPSGRAAFDAAEAAMVAWLDEVTGFSPDGADVVSAIGGLGDALRAARERRAGNAA